MGLSIRDESEHDITGQDGSHGWFEELSKLTEALRNRAHMLCFANSYEPLYPSTQWDIEGDRGWAHTSMWAHFAERHRGVCLELDKRVFLREFELATEETAIALAGDVFYLGSGDRPVPLPSLTVDKSKDATVDRMLSHALHSSTAIYFRKDSCWSYEQEFRVVAVNSCGEPIYIPIASSLRRVIVGAEFPSEMLPVLQWVLHQSRLPVSVHRMHWFQGGFSVGPHHLFDINPSTYEVDNPYVNMDSAETEIHEHSDACRPETATDPSPEDRLSLWREGLVDAYERRLKASLQSVAGELKLRFTSDPRTIRRINYSPRRTMLGLGIELRSAGKTCLRVFLMRPPPTAKKVDSLTLAIQVIAYGAEHREQSWDIPDDFSDSEILKVFAEIDDLINEGITLFAEAI